MILITNITYSQINLLCDEGFEESIANGSFPSSGCWEPASIGASGTIVTTTAAHEGSNGLWTYTGMSSNDSRASIYQEFPSTINQAYKASGWL